MTNKETHGEKAFAATQYKKEREYWVNKLSGEVERAFFPLDRRVGDADDRVMGALDFEVPGKLYARLAEIMAGSEPRLHMLLVTGMALLLYKYTGRDDIVMGIPINRQKSVGKLINSALALRFGIDGNKSVKEFLMAIKKTIVEAG
ncbi:MAG: non-ribosomal peptide synthetase, partial [bacterium]|nr:non-ribosomal peptide synthetase [bacterium]